MPPTQNRDEMEIVQRITRLETKLIHFEDAVGKLEKSIEALSKKIDGLKEFADQAKGGWKVLTFVSMMGGAVGALLTKIVPYLAGLPK